MTTIEKTFRRVEYLKKAAEKQKKENGHISFLIRLELEYFETILKDLEVLEKYKRVMCEPIKDIMKELELKDLLEIDLNVEKVKVEFLMKQLKKQDQILDQLKEILSMDYLVRVYDFEMAKRLQTYLKSNDIVKEWLENGKNNL